LDPERVERRLAAILAADVAGYSRLMGADEEGTHAALMALRREVSEPKIAQHRGRIVKTTGDGFLAEFGSVVDAVRCAVELQREMALRNDDVPSERRIQFRIGINIGDIIYSASDTGRPEWTFYSSFISNARRLPNGNTFIDEGMNGRFFQVTPAGEIVWEYVSPYFGEAPFGPGGKVAVTNWVYRAQPVPYDWVPAGTPHGEHAVASPDLSTFHLPAQR
jgi:hypothetical protein